MANDPWLEEYLNWVYSQQERHPTSYGMDDSTLDSGHDDSTASTSQDNGRKAEASSVVEVPTEVATEASLESSTKELEEGELVHGLLKGDLSSKSSESHGQSNDESLAMCRRELGRIFGSPSDQGSDSADIQTQSNDDRTATNERESERILDFSFDSLSNSSDRQTQSIHDRIASIPVVQEYFNLLRRLQRKRPPRYVITDSNWDSGRDDSTASTSQDHGHQNETAEGSSVVEVPTEEDTRASLESYTKALEEEFLHGLLEGDLPSRSSESHVQSNDGSLTMCQRELGSIFGSPSDRESDSADMQMQSNDDSTATYERGSGRTLDFSFDSLSNFSDRKEAGLAFDSSFDTVPNFNDRQTRSIHDRIANIPVVQEYFNLLRRLQRKRPPRYVITDSNWDSGRDDSTASTSKDDVRQNETAEASPGVQVSTEVAAEAILESSTKELQEGELVHGLLKGDVPSRWSESQTESDDESLAMCQRELGRIFASPSNQGSDSADIQVQSNDDSTATYEGESGRNFDFSSDSVSTAGDRRESGHIFDSSFDTVSNSNDRQTRSIYDSIASVPVVQEYFNLLRHLQRKKPPRYVITDSNLESACDDSTASTSQDHGHQNETAEASSVVEVPAEVATEARELDEQLLPGLLERDLPIRSSEGHPQTSDDCTEIFERVWGRSFVFSSHRASNYGGSRSESVEENTTACERDWEHRMDASSSDIFTNSDKSPPPVDAIQANGEACEMFLELFNISPEGVSSFDESRTPSLEEDITARARDLERTFDALLSDEATNSCESLVSVELVQATLEECERLVEIVVGICLEKEIFHSQSERACDAYLDALKTDGLDRNDVVRAFVLHLATQELDPPPVQEEPNSNPIVSFPNSVLRATAEPFIPQSATTPTSNSEPNGNLQTRIESAQSYTGGVSESPRSPTPWPASCYASAPAFVGVPIIMTTCGCNRITLNQMMPSYVMTNPNYMACHRNTLNNTMSSSHMASVQQNVSSEMSSSFPTAFHRNMPNYAMSPRHVAFDGNMPSHMMTRPSYTAFHRNMSHQTNSSYQMAGNRNMPNMISPSDMAFAQNTSNRMNSSYRMVFHRNMSCQTNTSYQMECPSDVAFVQNSSNQMNSSYQMAFHRNMRGMNIMEFQRSAYYIHVTNVFNAQIISGAMRVRGNPRTPQIPSNTHRYPRLPNTRRRKKNGNTK